MKLGKIAVLLAVLVLFGTCAYAADCKSGARYADNKNGTVTDCKTGLIWLKNANCTATSHGIANPKGELNWDNAQKWAAGLGNGICGLNDRSHAGDWRLPTKEEWEAMVQSARNQGFKNPALTNDAGTAQWSSGAGSSFTNVQSIYYWSSTTIAGDTPNAWPVDMCFGVMDYYNYKASLFYVWPVRGGQ